jgi:LacI family transcriptional regulator
MTVSRVINGENSVRPKTRHLVEQAIRGLNFSPNPLARALSGGDHVKIALVHRFPNPGHLGDFLAHLLDQTTKAHASLVVRKVASSADNEQTVQQLLSDGIRAVIVTPPLTDDAQLIALLRAAGMAMVAVGTTNLTASLSVVGIDDRAAARAMTEHLLAAGHRRIGFIRGHRSHASTQARLDGFYEALSAVGLAVEAALIVEGRYDYRSGLIAADHLLDLPEPPTAVFASNDEMAAATIAVAHRRGIDVPLELSVCGFDDSTLATTIWPSLTTVRQPLADMTNCVVNLLLEKRAAQASNGPAARERHVVLDHLIICRESDAPPRSLVRGLRHK